MNSRSGARAQAGRRIGRLGRLGTLPFCTVLALAASVLLAQPGRSAAGDARVTAASYTTGKAGHQLKWMPVRPSETATVKQAGATEDVTMRSSSPAARPVPSAPVDAFDDPFEDSRQKPAPVLLRGLAQDAALPAVTNDASDGAAPRASSEERKRVPSSEKPKDEIAALGDNEPRCPDPSKKKKDDDYFKRILQSVPARVEAGKKLPKTCPPPDATPYNDRAWSQNKDLAWSQKTFTWKASGLCHKPVYFEDESLERYGHGFGPWLQPIVSGGHFFLTVPALPYVMALYPPNECVYSLGYYRPGSCAPYALDPLPLSIRAVIAEGGIWTGLVFLIP